MKHGVPRGVRRARCQSHGKERLFGAWRALHLEDETALAVGCSRDHGAGRGRRHVRASRAGVASPDPPQPATTNTRPPMSMAMTKLSSRRPA